MSILETEKGIDKMSPEAVRAKVGSINSHSWIDTPSKKYGELWEGIVNGANFSLCRINGFPYQEDGPDTLNLCLDGDPIDKERIMKPFIEALGKPILVFPQSIIPPAKEHDSLTLIWHIVGSKICPEGPDLSSCL